MDFKDKMFELRKASGLSQEEVANQLGVSRQSVSKWEAGQSTPEMDKLPAISELFQVSLDYLVKPAEMDMLSIKTMQLEAQQKVLEQKLRKKQNTSFLVVSILVGVLVFLAGTLLIMGARLNVDDPRSMVQGAIGAVPALLFLMVGAVVVANYIHTRKNKL